MIPNRSLLCSLVLAPVVAAGCSDAANPAADGAASAVDIATVEAGKTCEGRCAAIAPAMWSGPALLWLGAEKDAPPCPMRAPTVAREGRADLIAPGACGPCTCSPPVGSCALPATMTAHAATCANIANGTPATPFNPTANWNGDCDASNGVPAGKLCAGTPCVQSLTIPPPTISEGGCTPSPSSTPVAPRWGSFGRACTGMAQGTCVDPLNNCVAAPPSGSTFQLCIYQDGDTSCPVSGYTERHVVFAGVEDKRACTPCTCGAPSGSRCSARISIYTDGACSSQAFAQTVDSTGPLCHDLPAGSPLGSRSAAPSTYAPGSCNAAGGTPIGMAKPTMAVTFCCLKAQ